MFRLIVVANLIRVVVLCLLAEWSPMALHRRGPSSSLLVIILFLGSVYFGLHFGIILGAQFVTILFFGRPGVLGWVL